MATVNDVPADLQHLATKVPEDVLKRLSSAELNARCRWARKYAERGDNDSVPEYKSYVRAQVKRILEAKPVAEHLSEVARLHGLLQSNNPPSVTDALKEKYLKEMRTAAHYPDGLVNAVDQALLGRATGIPELDNIAQACLNRHRPS